jgi:glutathione S-transferase
MKLYYHHFASPPVRKVRAVAFQLELTLDEIKVDYEARAHQSSGYAALNPNAKFPTLTDGDFVLWESNAICQYLAARVPAAGLLPLDDERARADVTRWQSWELSHFSPAARKLINHHLRLVALDPETLRRDEDEFRRYAAVLDGHLKGRRFLVGERVTVADFCVASMLMYAEEGKLPLAELPEIRKWFAGVEAQPGWRKSAPAPVRSE